MGKIVEPETTAPLTEPIIVPDVFVTGFGLEMADSHVRLVCWVDLPPLSGQTEERRICARLAMTDEVARQLSSYLRGFLSHDTH